jgi:hypothetical protein
LQAHVAFDLHYLLVSGAFLRDRLPGAFGLRKLAEPACTHRTATAHATNANRGAARRASSREPTSRFRVVLHASRSRSATRRLRHRNSGPPLPHVDTGPGRARRTGGGSRGSGEWGRRHRTRREGLGLRDGRRGRSRARHGRRRMRRGLRRCLGDRRRHLGSLDAGRARFAHGRRFVHRCARNRLNGSADRRRAHRLRGTGARYRRGSHRTRCGLDDPRLGLDGGLGLLHRTAFDHRGTDAFLHHFLCGALLEMPLDALDGLGSHHAHVVSDLADADRLQKSDHRSVLQTQIAGDLVDSHVVYPSSVKLTEFPRPSVGSGV